jgi:hypothetical protein
MEHLRWLQVLGLIEIFPPFGFTLIVTRHNGIDTCRLRLSTVVHDMGTLINPNGFTGSTLTWRLIIIRLAVLGPTRFLEMSWLIAIAAEQVTLGVNSLTRSVVLIIAPSPIVLRNKRLAMQRRLLGVILILITLKITVIAIRMVVVLIIPRYHLSLILVNRMARMTRGSLAITIPQSIPILLSIIIPVLISGSLSQVLQLLRNSEHPLFTLLRWGSNEMIGILYCSSFLTLSEIDKQVMTMLHSSDDVL